MTAAGLIAGRYAVSGGAQVGGMGTVYRAIDRTTGRPVAVKVLELADPGSVGRFAREAHALARLAHPHIVAYVDHGRHRGSSYLVMEWLDGQSLAAALESGLRPEESARIAAAAAGALDHAHAAGLVHRDIKPDNLMLCTPGGLKVVDFGIARWAGPRVRFTETGSVVGTPGYMAPEQARGVIDIDGRADVFSLGCVLYQCLSGCPAFAGENPPATLVKICVTDPTPLGELAPGVPDPVVRLVEAMLHKDPAARPRAVEVAEALHRLAPGLSGLPVAMPRVAEATVVTGAPACVLLAAPVPGRPETEWSASQQAQVARAVAATPGGRLEWLIDGAFLITIAEPRDPGRQARAAAQLALELSAGLPDFLFALSIGLERGDPADRAGRVLLDAVMERAIGGFDAAGALHVDLATAALLGDSFVRSAGLKVCAELRGSTSPPRSML